MHAIAALEVNYQYYFNEGPHVTLAGGLAIKP